MEFVCHGDTVFEIAFADLGLEKLGVKLRVLIFCASFGWRFVHCNCYNFEMNQ